MRQGQPGSGPDVGRDHLTRGLGEVLGQVADGLVGLLRMVPSAICAPLLRRYGYPAVLFVPIGYLDDEGYLISKGPFKEAVGPSFWERGSA